MAKQKNEKAPKPEYVTTNTGRILRVDQMSAPPVTPVVNSDPARRDDVLFRKRRAEGHEVSVWWMIGAFVVTSGLVITLLSWVPGNA